MRLNPFAFPATTDSWFVLLLVSVAGAITFIYNWLATLLPAYRLGVVSAAVSCTGASRSATTELARAAASPLRDPSPQLSASQSYFDCVAGFHRDVLLVSLSGLPLLAIVAGLAYWLAPVWIIRRRGLVELDRDDAADVLTELAALCRDAGLKRAPAFLGAPGSRSTDAVAFGRRGQRYIGLDQGLITLYYTHPEQFRAVVLHELAHVRNRDVDKAYLVLSFSVAFAIVGLLPLLVSLIGQPWGVVAGLIVRALIVVALVAVTGTSVLRARESYADVRAATWADARRGLGDVLQAVSATRSSGVSRLLRFHPTATERQTVLGNTSILFRADVAEAVATGLTAAIILPRLTSTFGSAFLLAGDSAIAPTLAAVILAPLITGIVGLAVWRAVFASLAADTRAPACGRLALGLAAGLILGQLVAFDAFVEAELDGVTYAALSVLWGAVAAVVLYGFLRWVAQGAGSWLMAASSSSSPRLAYVSGLGLASLVLIVGLAALISLNSHALAAMGAANSGPLGWIIAFGVGALGSLYVLVSLPVTIVAIVGVWAYPLAARYWRPTVSAANSLSWAYLDPVPPPTVQTPTRSGLRLPLSVGLGLGVVCSIACLILSLQYDALPQSVRIVPEEKLRLYSIQVLVCVVLETVGGVTVAMRAPALKAAHGLFSAFVTAIVATVAIHVIVLSAGGSINVQFLRTTLSAVVVVGSGVAMLAAGLAGAFSGGSPGRV